MGADGRLVLITGASSGIGRATSRAFIGAGDRVIGVARDAARLQKLSDELGGAPQFVGRPCDVTDPTAVARLADELQAEHGAPDVVVANAGVGLDALFIETTDEAFRRVFEVNVFGVVSSVRPFVAPMVERGSGRILIVSSIVGKRGTPFYSAYSASKFALHGMADSLHAELYGTGVSLGLICPSSTTTEFQDRMERSGPGQKRFRPRRHSPDAVAQAIVRMAGSRRREMIFGFEAKLLWLLDTVAPRFTDRFLARVLRS